MDASVDPHGGYSEGVNEFGVSIGNEMFPSHHLPTDDGRQAQAEFTDLDRLVLERSRTAKEAVLNFADLVGKYGQTCKRCPEAANYNSLFMISDPHEIYSLVSGLLVSSAYADARCALFRCCSSVLRITSTLAAQMMLRKNTRNADGSRP